MNFGPQTSEADSFAIMDKALEIGIQFFDTANVYGGKGTTEIKLEPTTLDRLNKIFPDPDGEAPAAYAW